MARPHIPPASVVPDLPVSDEGGSSGGAPGGDPGHPGGSAAAAFASTAVEVAIHRGASGSGGAHPGAAKQGLLRQGDRLHALNGFPYAGLVLNTLGICMVVVSSFGGELFVTGISLLRVL